MSAVVLPLHHLVSHPRGPQPCCHSVLWGFCLLSCSLLHPHSPFSTSFTTARACAEAQLAQPGLLHPAVSPLLLRGDTEESRRMAVTPLSCPQSCWRSGPSSISGSYPFCLQRFQRQRWGTSSVLPTTPHILGNREHPSGAHARATAACRTRPLPWILWLIVICAVGNLERLKPPFNHRLYPSTPI